MSLSRLLQTQTSRLGELLHLLTHEQELLLAGQADGKALEQAAHAKQSLLDALDAAEKGRLSIQGRLGYSTDPEGARQAAEDADCLEEWQTMLELARQTARQNQRNGYLINARVQHNRQMLHHLQSIVEARPYTAKGQHRASDGQLNASA